MLWSVSYWLGVAGLVVLLTLLGVPPFIVILLTMVALRAFINLANRRDAKNDNVEPRHREWNDDDDD